MLNSKVEKVIFIFVFIILFIFVGYYTTKIKANYLPINIDLTPEQIIESEFKEIGRDNLHYNYLIMDDFLIACIESKTGQGTIHIAFKNDVSGFMFGVPGTVVGSINEGRYIHTLLSDDSLLLTSIIKYKTKYVILIEDLQKRNIDIYANNEKLEPLSTDVEKNTCWADVCTDLSNDFEIQCTLDGENYQIISNKEIEELFGGRA